MGIGLTNTSAYYRKYPLTFRLLVYILLCSSFVTLLTTIFQIAVDYNRDVASIETRFREIEISHSKIVSMSIWNFDESQIENLLNGILMLPDIEYVEIRTEYKNYSVGKNPKTKFLTYEFKFTSDDPNQKLGSVFIAASLENVYQRLKERVVVILGSQAVKTFLVSSFILFIIRHLVTRHLNTMAEFAQRLDLKKLNQFLVLNRKKTKSKDELDRVTLAINHMIKNLGTATKEMEIQARLQGELNAAATIQKACTPKTLPVLDDFEMAAQFNPAKEMSGDYFDIIKIDDRHVVFVIADVSGKGVSAAMYANITRVLVRDKETLLSSPVKLLSSLNQSLKKEFHSNHFLTMSYMVLDLKKFEVTYASAGHEPLILIRGEEKKITFLKPRGYPFSDLHADLFEERICQETILIHSGDLLFLYTDGLTDAENKQGEMFGEDRLYETLLDLQLHPVSQIPELIAERIRKFSGAAQQNDDITMIALKRV